jgi:phosphoglycerol transferase MdoB-like AlkP superfamily enzyme
LIVFFAYKQVSKNDNPYIAELGKNGLFELFSAFNNNSLDYLTFYSKINDKNALDIVRSSIIQSDQRFINNYNIDRIQLGASSAKKVNVVLIVVESLSAEFMQSFGNTKKITPFLDNLAQESILFTKLYATGTRTVRGLEALLLSIPPTPGSSIVRRANIANLFNAGSVFAHQNYDLSFIYGGYSYFDNMHQFFASNGYRCIDRLDLRKDQITFANVWGVADEDLFNKSIDYYDEQYSNNKAFFSVLLTTSNHRPFNFPANKIDLPSGSREAAVKYTDYAIGEFIKKASVKPWFENTVFIISADHCASSAGKMNLPVAKYHIPVLIYAPKILAPTKIDSISSQIDVMPTVFGLLGFEYKTKFFGQDVLKYPANRAFIGTYQLLGYLQNQQLAILGPKQSNSLYQIMDEGQKLVPVNDDILSQAIAFYQSAYLLFKSDQIKEF